ncbi:DUF3046 domain-containing protein [Kytococcus sedentarius]|uniref:DUF3046 domain-containing protein n=1 Tax=Kytococcus sedentarius TaxID=1276 RepID=UPI0035BBBCDF
MRISQLQELMNEEFGPGMTAHIRGSHVLSSVPGDQTVDDALAHGVSPREIWRALCVDFDVPPERQLGRDPGRRAGAGGGRG